MIADLLTGSTFTKVDGGLINTLYRVTTPAGDAYALRMYVDLPHASAASRFEREIKLLPSLPAELPVPRPVVADASRAHFPQPFVLYPWIDGMTLNECRRAHGEPAMLSTARELGRTLALTASSSVRLGDDDHRLEQLSVADALAKTDVLLAGSLARHRLGEFSADALRGLLDTSSNTLIDVDRDVALVHRDFGGRNIIVRLGIDGSWIVAGILDWESAALGSPLWDVGSLFRYSHRYSPGFRAEFAHGYREVFDRLPDDWWLQSRLIDATRIVPVLNDDIDRPTVFDDCREIVADLIDPARHAC